MSSPLVVGVDGGNTKTVAAVATTAGDVLGAAVGTGSDIYGPPSAEVALDVLAGVVSDALAGAGVPPEAVVATVGSLAGADWPEDYELYRSELMARLCLGGRLEVVNDGVGPLRLSDPGGRGVAVVLGTGAAVGARGPEGATWHASFWLSVGGAEWLGKESLTAVSRAALGAGAPTSLTAALPALLGAGDAEAALHALTRRDSPYRGKRWERDAGRLLLDHDAAGDAVAREIVADYASRVAPYVMIAAEKVGIRSAFDVVLTGGLLRHPTSSLASCLKGEIESRSGRANVVRVTAAPVAGAVLEAIALTGAEVTRALVDAVAGAELLALQDQSGAPVVATSPRTGLAEFSRGSGGPVYDAAAR